MRRFSTSSPALYTAFLLVVSSVARTRSATAFHKISSKPPGWFEYLDLPTGKTLAAKDFSDPHHDDSHKADGRKLSQNAGAGDDNDGQSNDSATSAAEQPANSPAEETVESVGIGVKSHQSKKSNAVGDPDGEGSDDDDSDTEIPWDNEQLIDLPTPVQVEVELIKDKEDEESPESAEEGADDEAANAPEDSDAPSRGGGVGVRLGRLAGRRLKNKKRSQKEARSETKPSTQAILQAWKSFVFFPPSSEALSYLSKHARQLDSAARTRLDRRTLYAGLMLEWLPHLSSATSNNRKYLDSSTAQALQAALSMACQPQWRKTWPRHNAIRLYDSDSIEAKACTLAMQETIATALAHSLGTGIVYLDDETLLAIRQKLLEEGFPEESLKPTMLIQTLLSHGRSKGEKKLIPPGRSIAQSMKYDLDIGLDDPFDERATMSFKDMEEWEKFFSGAPATGEGSETQELPLVVFVRVDSCKGLLKSKSAVETLLKECSLSESTNLVVLGKGIDAKTTILPQETREVLPESHEMSQGVMNAPSAPWFGFSPNNQNASGQNDPEGSRRFNIFLARTIDPNGTPGVLGAIAPPQAGNLFPHMMAMQARERLQQQQDDDSPAKAELEKWAQMLQSQIQSNGGRSLPPPQFFNASLSPNDHGDNQNVVGQTQAPPEFIQQTLQLALSELLDRLAEMNQDADESQQDLSPDLHKAFAQVLRNENLRRGIAEHLARAAPALSDPKCQGVMLSIYVPPPPQFMNRSKQPGALPINRNPPNMGNWFQKILNSQEESEDSDNLNSKKKRIRTLAAAAAVMGANMNNGSNQKKDQLAESKAERNLARLEALSRPIIVPTPSDPVRAKSWESWISRERGAAIFRKNRKVLNEQLESRSLTLQEHVGTRGAGSSLRQMLSVREILDEMEDVIKCAVELEAAKSQRQHESPKEMHLKETDLEIDITLSQLLLTDEGIVEDSGDIIASNSGSIKGKGSETEKQYIHPSSLEKAITMVCRISPSPAGGLSVSSGATASHRTREEITALAQDKHERALISQVVSPQDIGVTYDMIGGLASVKELLRQSITYPLKYPHLYSEGIAREAVKGVLLFGPPGTGKTMLAKAVATEGGASFLSVDASSVENKWLGESEKNAKAVFTLARRLAPCVIFIDEVDSLLSSREGTSDDSAHGTLTSVKTTMMAEWDGLVSNGAGDGRVVVIGSTNRPFDLDEAVLRRFPRRILVDLPDLETRTEILEVTLAENRIDANVNLTKIAERLEGYTGSDIKEVCREAVVQISHEQAKLLDQDLGPMREDVTQGSLQRLRPVTIDDFEKALAKLKRSVSDKGRELARVWEWNDEYGEIKREQRHQLPHLAGMYL